MARITTLLILLLTGIFTGIFARDINHDAIRCLEKYGSNPENYVIKTFIENKPEKLEQEYASVGFDKELVAILDTIYDEDQNYRLKLGDIEKEFGRDSEEMKAHWEMIHDKDEDNLIKITKILDTRGWLGPDIIGEQGNLTLFLVIQHADIDTQIKYMPMIREAVKNGNAKPDQLALLEDRIAMRQGKKQVYGSQVMVDPETGEYYVSPIEDPENVDKRRAEVGLQPMSEYLGIFNLTWDVEKHKQRTAKIEAEKNQD